MLRQTVLNMQQRAKLVGIAQNEVGVREKSGRNDGIKVSEYLALVKLKAGEPWCAAYISWVFAQAGYAKPRTGWSPDLFPSFRLARSALPGNLIGVYFPEKGRIAHVGMIVKTHDDWITSCEGNTNIQGGREGDGVYLRTRHRRTISTIADWVSERGKRP